MHGLTNLKTKNFVVILIVISLGTLALHHHVIEVYVENK